MIKIAWQSTSVCTKIYAKRIAQQCQYSINIGKLSIIFFGNYINLVDIILHNVSDQLIGIGLYLIDRIKLCINVVFNLYDL